MTVAEAPRESWERIDRNAGKTGGWLYSIIINKGGRPWMTGWLSHHFEDFEDVED